MNVHRFFIPSETISDGNITFPANTARQIRRVLRLKPGQAVVILDGQGWEYKVELTQVNADIVEGRIYDKSYNLAEAPVKLTMLLSLTQREKFEWMLQKCTEIGAHAFIPLITNRSLVQLSALGPERMERWQRIIIEAAEQSGRGIIPMIEPPQSFDQAIRLRSEFDQCLIAWEEEQSLRLRTALHGSAPDSRIAVLIGPEGGLSREEIDFAINHDWQVVSLGKRILRMETAALVGCALVMDAVQ